VIAEVIACLCTSSVGFPDFILRGEVRRHLDRNGHGKDLLARTEAFVHVLQLPREMQVPCFGNAVSTDRRRHVAIIWEALFANILFRSREGQLYGSTMLKTPKIRKSRLLVVINEVIPAVKYVAPSKVSKMLLRPSP
jgi:hypothetical protein